MLEICENQLLVLLLVVESERDDGLQSAESILFGHLEEILYVLVDVCTIGEYVGNRGA